jgi:transcriptional regulator GlxA family with amidase domain
MDQRYSLGYRGGRMDSRITRVIELMRGDLDRAFPLRRMAESVNLSPTRLCYLFKSETGTPPARFLRSLRMCNAATLLTSTFLSVKEIRARVGFTDESHFVRHFKKVYEMTPSQYRNRSFVTRVNGKESHQIESDR